jgi:ABC-type transport system substrate-binding protein
VAVLGLSAVCGGGEAVAGPDGSTEGTGATGGTIRIGVNEDIATLDPHKVVNGSSEGLLSMVFQSLLSLDAQTDYVPGIADTYEVSEDLLTYTFHIRDGAAFHNGDPVTAEDVKWNFDRILDPETTSLLASALPIESVVAERGQPVLPELAHQIRDHGPRLGQSRRRDRRSDWRWTDEGDGLYAELFVDSGAE